ncbi:FkbM family methyltransferase [Dyadobacter luticola]|uniref:FkbM family methyltransferase n=1 Tax=Dyadobacter luticola TaxID=1979387 RepID=A0A5R9KX87_9BACT|nr:FkbM family methyltransferase [Dyadobacter luticola]TLV00781.1 FkbM family methyltransferase [Dyadobacter luticola]
MLKALQKLLPYLINLGVMNGILYLIRRKLRSNRVINLAGIKNPIYLRPGTSDGGVFGQIFIQHEYQINLSFEPKVIIDGGANIGLFSVYFKNKYPAATIIAIEPDEENFEMLQKNVAGYSDIHLKKAGLWSRNSQTRMVDKYNLGKWGMVIEEVPDTGGNKEEFNTLTIDNLLEEFNIEYIDLLKLDIETAEKQLFTENFATWLPRVKVIIIELHDWMQAGCSKPFFEAINQTFDTYSFGQKGENTIIVNRDLVYKQ